MLQMHPANGQNRKVSTALTNIGKDLGETLNRQLFGIYAMSSLCCCGVSVPFHKHDAVSHHQTA